MICYKCNEKIEDLSLAHYGLHKSCFINWFRVGSTMPFIDIARQDLLTGSANDKNFTAFNSSFFQGKFKKYSARLGNIQYILKICEKEYPELPATEFLCNCIAKSIKLNIPEFFLINFNGLVTFVTKNFIAQNSRTNLHHIYHYLNKKDNYDVQTLLKIIETKTGKLCEIEKFVELCLFDALIGNHDRHGRNLAFIEKKGNLILSPFYDNPSYIGIENELLEAALSPRGKIATSTTNEPVMKDYVKEFVEIGFEDVVKKFYMKLNIDFILELISKSFISKKRKNALAKIVLLRYTELKNEIQS